MIEQDGAGDTHSYGLKFMLKYGDWGEDDPYEGPYVCPKCGETGFGSLKDLVEHCEGHEDNQRGKFYAQ